MLIICPQTTGVIVRANKRAQINILIQRMSGFPWVSAPKHKPSTVNAVCESVLCNVWRRHTHFPHNRKTRGLSDTIFPVMFINEVRDIKYTETHTHACPLTAGTSSVSCSVLMQKILKSYSSFCWWKSFQNDNAVFSESNQTYLACFLPLELDILESYWGETLQILTSCHFDSMMNLLDFSGQRSEVTVALYKSGHFCLCRTKLQWLPESYNHGMVILVVSKCYIV